MDAEIRMQEAKIQKNMHSMQIGNVKLYLLPQDAGFVNAPQDADFGNAPQGEGFNNSPDADTGQLAEIVEQYEPQDYQSQITGRKSWTAMYQLAHPRGNILEWMETAAHEKVLELSAGCGTVTSVLLEKGALVTCQEENVHYCRLNAVRHKEAEQLTVYAMPFSACGPYLEHDYDRIILIGMPAEAKDAASFLQRLRGHLKEGGTLVWAVENKFGLKYWAGNKEPQTGRYFAGLESDGVSAYSHDGLKKLFAGAGFSHLQFYYPYPDYRFARDIYSDKRLPKKGELTYNIANYEDDRILLFDEQKVFDSIIEEGRFPFFSNSFLCTAENGGGAHPQRDKEKKDQEIIYVRYASDRCREHAVRTEIVRMPAVSRKPLMEAVQTPAVSRKPLTETAQASAQEGDIVTVRKRPVYPEGAAHVRHIAQAYERLSRQYADTPLSFNRCALRTDRDGAVYAEFEYLGAQALQERIDQAVSTGDLEKIFDILRKMVQYIRNGSRRIPFAMTDGFKRVFGDIPYAAIASADCSEVSDIDLILSNILADADGTWHVIDYEWTFFFPIPQNFMIYRTLFFLNHENPQCPELAMDRLLEMTGIPQEEARVYAKMEEGFQQFVTGGLVPYREMVNLLERRFFNIAQLKADYDRIAAQNEWLKGRGVWKIARKLKKKLTGN